MPSMLPPVLVLGVAAVAALSLAVRRAPVADGRALRLASSSLAVATTVQALHFIEETATGFRVRLGEVLALPAMPLWFFLAVNVAWLGIWAVSIPAVRSGNRPALFAAWFLAIAGTLNGVAHPLLALVDGAYFPGLVSAPFVGVASLWLAIRLAGATAG